MIYAYIGVDAGIACITFRFQMGKRVKNFTMTRWNLGKIRENLYEDINELQ